MNIKAMITASLFCLIGSNASAAMISGTINIGGQSTVLNDGTNSTGIDFGGGNVNNFPAPTGDFTGLGGINTACGVATPCLTLTDFLYVNIPMVEIWAIDSDGNGADDFSFTLTSINVTSGDTPTFSNLVLNGNGYFTATGFDQTAGSYTFSQSGASFSSQTVPEPTTIALLGLGLLGFGAASRRLKGSA